MLDGARRERVGIELASEVIASVDGPRDADWDATWLAELDRRSEAAKDRAESGSDWTDVRARIPIGALFCTSDDYKSWVRNVIVSLRAEEAARR